MLATPRALDPRVRRMLPSSHARVGCSDFRFRGTRLCGRVHDVEEREFGQDWVPRLGNCVVRREPGIVDEYLDRHVSSAPIHVQRDQTVPGC
jgi:hypothetical protein